MLKVMIVDNEAVIRRGLIHCIRWESIGCVVAAQAEDGIDALEQFDAVKPNIVISDIRMPGMDGLELARRLHEEHPRTKTIILTGFPDFEYAQRAIEYQVVDFVLKPTSVENLTRAIEKARARIAEERSSQDMALALADKSEQNLRLQRGILLYDLINRANLSLLYVLNRMAQLELNLTSYYVLRIDIVSPDGGGEEQDLISCLHQAQRVLADCLSEYSVHFVPRGDQMCYAVLCAPASSAPAELCAEAVSILDSLFRFSLAIGISRHCTDPLRIAEAADEAGQAVRFARQPSESPVMDFDRLPALPQQAMERVYADLRLLKSAIEDQNRPSTRDIFVKLFTFIKENNLPIDSARNICIYIHQFCISLLFLPCAESCVEQNSLPTLKKLIEVNTIDELEENMRSFVEYMLDRTAVSVADPNGLVRTVKTCVAKHYSDELSLESLAARVYMSPSYLSRVFKRETGENLSIYIQNVRIDAAKTLLRTTSLRTYEVAERVGFSDPVYFSRIFKKITGVKPKDFRHAEE